MEKHCELSSNKYEQQSCTLTPSFKRGRLALFMMCIMVIQILSDISLEISNSNYFINLIITGICALSTLSFFLFVEKKTNLFIFDANTSSISPSFLSTYPNTIRRNMGTVAFRLKIRFSIISKFIVIYFYLFVSYGF